MHFLTSNNNFIDLWNKLLRYSKKYKISHEDLEDIVSESIVKALEHFDEDRGSFESLCLVIIKNKVFNFSRDNKFLFLLILIDEADDIIRSDNETFESKEQNIMALKFIDKLRGKLDEEELKLINAMYELCETSDKPYISKAARMIGIEPIKGWDIFRRIQRKVEIKKYEDVVEESVAKYFKKSEHVSDSKSLSHYIPSKMEYFNETFKIKIDERFERFVKSLSKDNLFKLERMYKD